MPGDEEVSAPMSSDWLIWFIAGLHPIAVVSAGEAAVFDSIGPDAFTYVLG